MLRKLDFFSIYRSKILVTFNRRQTSSGICFQRQNTHVVYSMENEL